jgi:signal transduction histidine kinase/ABC-type amino acid transport substrate-binding protein
LAALLLLAAPHSAAFANDGEVLRVGSELDYPPFALVDDNGEAAGFSVELFAEVARVMNLEVDVRVGPWGEVLADLREGRIDALPFVAISPERDEYLDFTVPVVVSRGAVFQRAGSVGIETEADLAGQVIGVMQDDIAHEYARRQDWAGDLRGFPSLEAAFGCLETGPCDAVVAPRLQGMLLARDRGLVDIVPADLSLDGFSLDYAMAVRKGDDALLAELNGGLAIVMADGTFDRIYERWLPDPAPRGGIPLDVLLKYAVGTLFGFLMVVSAMYWRQRQLRRLADARGRALEARAEDLRQLADRLGEERRDKAVEQRKTERAYGEARALIQVIPDLIFRFDPEGRYVDCHDPSGIAFRPFEEIRGRLLEEALPPEVARRAREAFVRAGETGAVQTVEYELPGSDGVGHTFEAKLAPYGDGGALAVVRDVSAARDREARLSRAADAVAAASAAKSRFLAAMSHELRTPLNAIIGFSEVLCREMFGPLGSPKYTEYASDIHASGRNLLSLISDVLDFSKIEAGKLTLNEETVDLGAVLDHKAALMKPMAGANGTRIAVRRPARPVLVRADDLQVQRMLMNLISNAVKFTSDGEVTVSVDRLADGSAAVTIADTGVGMSAEQLAHLGEPFYQAGDDMTRKTGGTGLGVCLVREMIALHGGEVVYDSCPDRGTVARLIFPADRVLAVAGTEPDRALAG